MVAIEKGERRLKPKEFVDLAAMLGLQVSELLQRRDSAEGFSVQLRSTLANDNADLNEAVNELQGLAEDYKQLEEICAAPLHQRYPPRYDTQGADPEMAAEDVAAAERSRLGWGEVPVANLRELLEVDVGLRIFQLKLPSHVAGIFAFTEELGACIAVNIEQEPERRRMSLAQEYGHFLTSRYRSEVTLIGRYERKPANERFAETFARAFLLPASGLRRRYLELARERAGGATVGDLCRLANLYSVPVEATTRRLEELRLIPAGTWERLRAEGFRLREAQRLLGLEPEQDEEIVSNRYVALAVEAWKRVLLSEGQLARFLRTDRLGARERIQRLEMAEAEFESAEGRIDLGARLLGAVGR